jgi:outer membrane protein assembly factor BamD
MHKFLFKLSALILALTLGGCGLFGPVADSSKNATAPKLYAEARDEMASGNYERAITLFEKLEASFPFGTYAQQAQMEIAYAYYKQQDQAQALAAIERFLKLHPGHVKADYMYYLRGLVNFNDQQNFLNIVYVQDPTERDPKGARESFEAFKALVQKYPNSEYTPDAILRMKYLVSAMAQYEMHVARYYFRRGAYLSAVNRAQAAVTDYRESPATEEALYMMAQGYKKLGMPQLADDALRVLAANYPKSAYLTGGPQAEKAWWKLWK